MRKHVIAALAAPVVGVLATETGAQDMENVLVTGVYAPKAEITAAVSVLDEEAIRDWPLGDHLEADRPAPVEGQWTIGRLHPEGPTARRHSLTEPVDAGVTRLPRLSLADV